MKIVNFIKDETDKLISIFGAKRGFRGYKYCTTVHIHNDVSSVIRSMKTFEKTHSKVMQKSR